MSRCVRRAFLCGEDFFSRTRLDHRKDWLEKRIHTLDTIFSIDVYAYAVMSNHFHLVLFVDPAGASEWTDQDIAHRWLALFPPKKELYSLELKRLMKNPSRLRCIQQRLCSISWFMRCLKEPIARQANQEDACTGRFWEGRFRSQALLDRAAVLSCMAYVDLNPVRAGLSTSAESSLHTSIRNRLRGIRFQPQKQAKPLGSISQSAASPILSIDFSEYLELVKWSSRRMKKAADEVQSTLPAHLIRSLPHSEEQWIRQMHQFERDWYRAAGSVDRLRALASRLQQTCVYGMRTAKLIYATPDPYPP